MSYYQIIINDFARLSDGVLGNSLQPNLPFYFLIKLSIAFLVRKRYIIDVEKLNQQRFNCATQV